MFAPIVVQAFGFFEVRAIDLGVVLQLARLLDAVVERLTVGRSPASRRRDSSRSRPSLVSVTTVVSRSRRTVCDEPRVAEMPEFAVARVQRLVERVAEVVGRDDAEGAYRGQRAAFGAAERVVVVAELNVLPFEATRQVDAVHEHVARLHAFTFARV